jgi:ATP-binding cassette, subfamily B (MDR/TAP), member 1
MEVTQGSLDQYSQAASVVSETLASIRTVSALNAQVSAINTYRGYLFAALQLGVRKGLKVGVGVGLLYGTMFLTYGLGFWYGARLVAEAQESGCTAAGSTGGSSSTQFSLHTPDPSCPSGGDVLTVFFCAVMGSMALGQITPALTAVTAARYVLCLVGCE